MTNNIPPSIQQEARRVFFSEKAANNWLGTPNAFLKNQSPADVIQNEGPQGVRQVSTVLRRVAGVTQGL